MDPLPRGLGMPELVMLFVVALILFGPRTIGGGRR
jgi:Sec-independent protein translocase protein TatA